MPPPSVTDLLQQVKLMVDKLDIDKLAEYHIEIELLKQKTKGMLSKEDVRDVVKEEFKDRDAILSKSDEANSKWTKPLIQILVVVITAIIVSYITQRGFIK